MRLGSVLPSALAFAALLVIGKVAGATPSTALDTMEQRMQACVVCHGKEGRATSTGYFPRIAEKPAGYLYNQLVNFRDGRRKNATMAYLVGPMSDAYLREIAGYFASLDQPYPPAQKALSDSASMERGARLMRSGDAGRELPACIRCHGDALTGVAPAIPGLLGLSRDYLLAQFGAWRTGGRAAAPPDCMATIARRLDAEDVSAIAAWLSSQPPPAAAKPINLAAAKRPMDCGSGLQ